MNVFLPEQSVMDCVRDLDDNRLMKQILEIKVLLNGGAGYAHHPVKIFYADKQDFLRHYGFSCCVEYYVRFGKIHKYADDFKTPFNVDNEQWKAGIYAEGSKDSSACIRETDPLEVQRLFREKLTRKWDTDKKPPKWTKRGSPVWYKGGYNATQTE